MVNNIASLFIDNQTARSFRAQDVFRAMKVCTKSAEQQLQYYRAA